MINVNKPGKVRVVFDCTATYDSISLNSQLLQGPNIMNNLVGFLIRFRQKQIALARTWKPYFTSYVFMKETVMHYASSVGRMEI